MLTSLTIQYMRSMMRMRERMKVSSRQQWPSKLNPWLFLKMIIFMLMLMLMIKDTCTVPLRCVCEVSSSGRASPLKGSGDDLECGYHDEEKLIRSKWFGFKF